MRSPAHPVYESNALSSDFPKSVIKKVVIYAPNVAAKCVISISILVIGS